MRLDPGTPDPMAAHLEATGARRRRLSSFERSTSIVAGVAATKSGGGRTRRDFRNLVARLRSVIDAGRLKVVIREERMNEIEASVHHDPCRARFHAPAVS
jgi:hypothetical protein